MKEKKAIPAKGGREKNTKRGLKIEKKGGGGL